MGRVCVLYGRIELGPFVYKIDATDCRSACIIRDDLHTASQIEARSHAVRTVKSESSFMPQDSSSPRRVLLVEDTEINRVSCIRTQSINWFLGSTFLHLRLFS
jgi:hypothetical protein